MAILVSNPSTVQFTGAPTEPQDPAVNPLDAVFTEELANAMQPTGQQADGSNLAQKPLVPLVDSKLNDLQILPPDVLMNAVGEANFAFVAQGAQAFQESALIKEVSPEVSKTPLLDALDPTQAAEMAAAELAAQMAAQIAPVDTTASVSQASIASGAVDSVDALSAGVDLVKAPSPTDDVAFGSQTRPISGNSPSILETGEATEVSAAKTLNAIQTLDQDPEVAVMQGADSKSVVTEATNFIAAMPTHSKLKNTSDDPVISVESPAQQLQAAAAIDQPAATGMPVGKIPAEALSKKVNQVNPTTGGVLVKASQAQSVETSEVVLNVESATQSSASFNFQKSAFDIAKSDVAKPIEEDSANLKQPSNLLQASDASMSSVGDLEVVVNSESINVNTTLLVESNVLQNESPMGDSTNQLIQIAKSELTQESSFKFDAKLGAQSHDVALAGKAKTSVPVSLGGAAGPEVPVSLAASVPLKGASIESQVIVASGAVVTTKAQTTTDGKVVVVESAVQTTTITTNIVQPGEAPVVQKTASTTTKIQASNSPDSAVTFGLIPATVARAELQQDSVPVVDFPHNRLSESIPKIETKNSVQLTENLNSAHITQAVSAGRQDQVRPEMIVEGETLSDVVDELFVNQFAAPVSSNGTSASRLSQGVSEGLFLSASDVDPDGNLANTRIGGQQVTPDSSSVSVSQSDALSPAAMGFSDASSTFVSTLIGGPQRPITTVMDWVALKPQEPSRPVMPHELRLDAGAVQVEIQRMVKQGGGHVVMELTPPDQSKFTIELKLDDMGGAYLKVEGVSDSTKTRLEQSAPQLQEQFQQMGLNLQLDMRQNRDSSSSGAAEWTSNEFGIDNNQPQETTPQATRAAAAERARKNNGGQVYLYA